MDETQQYHLQPVSFTTGAWMNEIKCYLEVQRGFMPHMKKDERTILRITTSAILRNEHHYTTPYSYFILT